MADLCVVFAFYFEFSICLNAKSASILIHISVLFSTILSRKISKFLSFSIFIYKYINLCHVAVTDVLVCVVRLGVALCLQECESTCLWEVCRPVSGSVACTLQRGLPAFPLQIPLSLQVKIRVSDVGVPCRRSSSMSSTWLETSIC